MSYSFFIAITQQADIFCMKRVKSRLFKKYLDRKKSQLLFCLSLSCYISVKKIIENCNSVGAGAQNLEKVVNFWPNFDPNFIDIWKA